jgi:hypothetical protein
VKPRQFAPAAVAAVVFFVVSLVSGADLGLALAFAGGAAVVVGAIYAARRNPERLLPLACLAGAGALFASEFMTTFQLSSTGAPLCNIGAADRHHFALGILAIFAVIAVVIAMASASKPAATSVAVAGVLALVLFLTIDLPDANNVGTLAGCSPSTTGAFFDAKAIPQAGFWLEMLGALALALSGVALATLTPEQLRSTRPSWLPGTRKARGPEPKPGDPDEKAAPDGSPPSGSGGQSDGAPERRTRSRGRPRARRRG